MSSNRPLVPRLEYQYHLWLGATEVIRFNGNKHRTYFAIEDDDTHDLHMWVGDNPDPNIGIWWSITNETIFFEYGVYGPLWFAETGGSGGDMKTLSSLIEEPDIIEIPFLNYTPPPSL